MPRVPDVRPLAVLAAAVTVLGVAGVLPVWGGTAQQVALPPLDLFADVRVLLAEAPSYPSFVAGLVAAVGARSLVLAAMLRALDRAGLVRAARFYVLALPCALVAGGLAFSGVAAVYSPFLWTGIAITIGTALVMGPRPWRPAGVATATAKVLAYVVALLVVSLLSALGGTAARLVLVWISAGLTAATARWMRVARAGVRSIPVTPGGSPLRPTAFVVLLALVAPVAGVAARSTATPPPTSQEGSLFVVPGIGGSSGTSTMFGFDPAALGYDCDATAYFSYAGPGRGAPQRDARCPIRQGAPYRAADTRRPLAELVRFFRAQYAALEPPVVVIAHSQGGWIAAAALGRDPGAGVASPAALVLLGAFPDHRRGYQLDGTGPGVVGTDALEVLMAGLRGLRGTTFDPRAPLARELLGTEGTIERVTRQTIGAGVPVVTVTSAFDLPIMTGDRGHPDAAELCPVYVLHGALPDASEVYAGIRQALDGEAAPRCGWWRRWPLRAFSAFAVPER
jgi:hypothetical protein